MTSQSRLSRTRRRGPPRRDSLAHLELLAPSAYAYPVLNRGEPILGTYASSSVDNCSIGAAARSGGRCAVGLPSSVHFSRVGSPCRVALLACSAPSVRPVVKYVCPALVIVLSLAACKKAPAANVSAAAPGAQTAAAAAPAAASPPRPSRSRRPARRRGEGGWRVDQQDGSRISREGISARAGGEVPAERRAEVYRGVLDSSSRSSCSRPNPRRGRSRCPMPTSTRGSPQVKEQFPSEDAFAKALAGQGMTVEKVEARRPDEPADRGAAPVGDHPEDPGDARRPR